MQLKIIFKGFKAESPKCLGGVGPSMHAHLRAQTRTHLQYKWLNFGFLQVCFHCQFPSALHSSFPADLDKQPVLQFRRAEDSGDVFF